MTPRWMAAAAATVVLAGCGGDDEPAGTGGLAQAVPAQGTVLFAEALVRPGDDRAEGVEAALRKVARRDDVLDLLVAEIDESLTDEVPGFTYSRDVEPWLGERVAVFLTGFDDEPDGAMVLEVTDEDAARSALEKARTGFDRDTEGELIDGRLVVGSTAGVEAARRAAEGESLAAHDAYEDALAPLAEERLGHVWVDARRALDSLAGVAGLEAYRDSLRDVDNAALAIALDADEERLAIEAAAERELTEAVGGLADGRDTAASELLGDLPADAWLAFGVAGAGEIFARTFESRLQFGAPPGFDLLGEIERRSGVHLREDLLDRIDDMALYASGTGITSLGAGFLVAADDSARVLDSIRKLVESFASGDVAVEPSGDDGFIARLRAAPFSVQVERDGDRVAAGLGGDAADELLDPDERLGDSDAYDQALEDLGEDARLSGLIQVRPLVELASGLAGSDPDWTEARPYLEAFERLSFGDRTDGDAVVTRIVARLR